MKSFPGCDRTDDGNLVSLLTVANPVFKVIY
jgi:hypothetical protein